MSKKCKIIYYDKNFNKSSDYYGATNPETARENYLRSMAHLVNTQFQKSGFKAYDINKLREKSRDNTSERESGKYDHYSSGSKLTKDPVKWEFKQKSSTSKIKAIDNLEESLKERGHKNFIWVKLKEELSKDDFGSLENIDDYIKSLKQDDNKKQYYYDKLNTITEKYFNYTKKPLKEGSDIEVFSPTSRKDDLSVADIDAIDKSVNNTLGVLEAGTYAHSAFEEFALFLQKLIEADVDLKNLDFFNIARNPTDPKVKKIFDESLGLKKFLGLNASPQALVDYSAPLKSFYNMLKNDPKFKNGFNLLTEVGLLDNQLEAAGSIDLVVIDSNGDAYLYDYKTIAAGSEKANRNDFFTSFTGKIDNKEAKEFNLFDDSRGDKVGIQLSFYKTLFEKQYKLKVKGLGALLVANGGVDVSLDPNTKQKYFSSLQMSEDIISIESSKYEDSIFDYIKRTSGIDLKAEKKFRKERKVEPNKINNSTDFIEELVSESALKSKKENKEDKRINNEVYSPRRDINNNDKPYFLNRMNGKMVYFESVKANANESEESRRKREIEVWKKQFREYLEEEKKKDESVSNEFLSFFSRGGNVNFVNSSKKQIEKEEKFKTLLGDIDPQNYKLIRISSEYPDFDYLPPNIFLAKNKIDDSGQIIIIESSDSINMEFGENKKGSKNQHMFGKYISKQDLIRDYKTQPMKNNSVNFKLFEANLILFELYKKGEVSKTLGARLNSSTFRKTKTEPMSSQSALELLKVSKKILDNERKDNKGVRDFSSFMNDVYFQNDLSEATHNAALVLALRSIDNLFNYSISRDSLKNNLKELEQYSPKQRFEGKQTKIKETIILIGDLLKGVKDENTKKVLNNLILELKGIKITMGDGTKGEKIDIDNRFRTPGRMVNEIQSSMWSMQQEIQSSVNNKFKKFSKEHGDIVRDFLNEEAGSKGRWSMKKTNEAFSKLFVKDPRKIDWDSDNPFKDNNDLKNAFLLKSENDSTLTKKQKEYIKYFNDKVDEYVESMLTPYQKEIFKKDRNRIWSRGRVPLVFASTNSDIYSTQNFSEKLKKMKEALGKMRSNKKTGNEFEFTPLDIESQFADQISETARHNKMNVDATGKKVGEKPLPLEIDLSLILNTFVSSNIYTEEAKEMQYIHTAMQHALEVEANTFHLEHERGDIKESQQRLIEMFSLYSKNLYKDEKGSGMALVDQGNKMLSMIALGLSPKQLVLELSTNLFQSVSSLMSQHMKGKDRRFGVDDWSYAGLMIMGRLKNYKTNKYASSRGTIAEHIVNYYGIYDSDVNLFKSYEFSESKKRFLWRSKWLYSMNNLPYKFFKAQAFIAEMKRRGLLNSLSTDDKGNIVYDKMKDPRFLNIFKKDGTLKENITSEEDKKAVALYKTLLNEAEKEGTLIEKNGVKDISMPLTLKEGNAMKDFSTSIYGSLDKDAQVLASYAAIGRLFGKFKTWMSRKKDNYFTTGHYSKTRGKYNFIKDESLKEGGYMEWESEWVEGVFQTYRQLAAGIVKERGNIIKAMKNFKEGASDMQKDNINKLVSDMALFSLLSIIIGAAIEDLDDDDKGSKFYLRASLGGATDLSPFALSKSFFDSGSIVTFSFFTSMASKSFDALINTASMDFEEAGEDIKSVFSKSGLIKSTASLFEE